MAAQTLVHTCSSCPYYWGLAQRDWVAGRVWASLIHQTL